MINKEIIYRNGGIERDFINKQIPQYSHMQVNVNCLIPAALLQGLPNYAVMLAMEFKADDAEDYEQRPSLVMFTGKALTIDGIDYIKFMALLPINYTDKVGRLKLTPYIQTTAEIEVEVDGTLVPRTITAIQQTFTEGYLIVVKASRDTGDTSVEDPEQITALLALINSKRIFYVNEYREAAYGALLWHIWNDYNPALTIYKGAIIMAKYDKFQDTPEGPYKKKTNVYFNCQVTTGETDENYILMLDVETREMTKYYNIERTETEGAYNYSYQEEKVTYNKAAIDALIQDLWDAKVDKTTKINGYTLDQDVTLDNTDVGLGNVKNYDVESTPTASGNELYITSKGVYDALQLIYSALNGYATTSDLSAINTRLESVEAIIGSDDGDADNVINTLKEVIVVLNGLGEGANLLDLINAKANQSDLTALNNQINGENGIKDKVDILSERTNAYMEIKNSLGTIDILTTDWEANTGDTEYTYKWELTNGYLEGAVNCIVVYSKDSDTSMLCATTVIDDVNGKLIIYASELPTETISIEKIAVFNDLNAYINYSNEIVQQVLQNTSAISDINNTKLPQYTKKTKTIGNFTATIEIEDGGTTNPNFIKPQISIEKDDTHKAQIYVYGNNMGSGDVYGVGINVQNGSGTLTSISITQDLDISIGAFGGGQASIQVGTHSLTFDANGDLKIDGVAVGGGGGHKVLRIYSEAINQVPDEYKWYVSASDINDYVIDLATGSVPTSYNQGDIVIAVSYDVDTDNDYIDGVYMVNTSGLWGSTGDLLLELGMFAKSGGGSQLYKHNIFFTRAEDNLDGMLTIINDSPTKLESMASIATVLYNKGLRGTNKFAECNVLQLYSSNLHVYNRAYSSNEYSVTLVGRDSTGAPQTASISVYQTITDTVEEL